MAANELSFNDLSTILASIVSQATGTAALTATNTSEFVTLAQTALKTGYDPLLGAISQVLGKTIFSIRPYSRKFPSLMVSNQQYGNHVRKIQLADTGFESDARFTLTDGSSVDQYTVKKPNPLQTNFYGAETYAKSITIFKDQLDCAFTSPDEFQRFIAMVMQTASDEIEQAHEVTARMTIANFIGGKKESDSDNCIHLISEYNAELGLEGEDALDIETIYYPENFKSFMAWVYARIATISNMMTERSAKYHFNITQFGGTYDAEHETWSGGVDKTIMRHTPAANQRLYVLADTHNKMDAMVLANTYHDNYLKRVTSEYVNFWQSIATPNMLNVKASYLDLDGTVKAAASASEIGPVFGVLFDEEAMGYTSVNQWSAPTPFNAKGGYSNMYWHFTDRYWNDFTENGVVFLLD